MDSYSFSLQTIAIVASRRFDYGHGYADDKESDPAGKDLADFLRKRFIDMGATCPYEPVDGEDGWTFYVHLGKLRFYIFVHWAPIDNPEVDRWIIQPDICEPLLRALFGPRTVPVEIKPIVLEFRKILQNSSVFEDVKWVTQEEFNSLYEIELLSPSAISAYLRQVGGVSSSRP